MSYTPTPEKMAAIGFKPALCAFNATRYVSFDVDPIWNAEVFCYSHGRLGVLESHATHNSNRYLGIVPDEDFFDKLLVSVGFVRPAHPAPTAPEVTEEAGA